MASIEFPRASGLSPNKVVPARHVSPLGLPSFPSLFPFQSFDSLLFYTISLAPENQLDSSFSDLSLVETERENKVQCHKSY